MEKLVFLGAEEAEAVREAFGTPVYVYDEGLLRARARAAMAFPNAYGLTVRYAMKALPNAAVLRIFMEEGLHIDASSGFEAERALAAGMPAERIQITAQEAPANLEMLCRQGVLFNACSLRQLELYGRLFPGSEVSVRINPGLGSGHSNRTNVGGPSSSFGIWHGHVEEAKALAAQYRLRVSGMHTHIGSGSDPEVWLRCAKLALGIAARLPEAVRLSLGGGFKIARMASEKASNLDEIGRRILPEFEAFAREHGRELHVEIEPGTYLVGNAGAIVSTVTDVVDTGAEGYRFLKLDTGMTEVLRPSMYGAQHPMVVVPHDASPRGVASYLVVGHCCESGDILTPEPGNPEGLLPRELVEAVPGDIVVIEGSGAYCAGMPAKNYNSFPEAPEVLREGPGKFRLIRRRQRLAQIIENEVPYTREA